MSIHHLPPPDCQLTPEEARERIVTVLDGALEMLVALLGPNATQALVAGRVLRAQLKFSGQP